MAAPARLIAPDPIRDFARVAYYPDGSWYWGLDIAGYLILIEEFVAYGVGELVVTSHSSMADAAVKCASVLDRFVTVVDTQTEIDEHLDAFFDPIFKELHISHERQSAGFDQFFIAAGSERSGGIALQLYEDLKPYLTAARYQAEAQVNLSRLTETIPRLIDRIKTHEARARLALLRGLFDSYEPVTFDSVRFESSVSPAFASRFRAVLEDVTYQHLSGQARLLGMPRLAKHALIRTGRTARRLAEKPIFRGVLGLASTAITVVTGAALPDSAVATELLASNYLPPIVSLTENIARARAQWIRLNPQYIAPGNDLPLGSVVRPAGFDE